MRRFAALVAILMSAQGPVVAEETDSAAVERAFRRGAACLQRDFDGTGFRDPYLTYVYPDERLPSPPDIPRLTYRLVDAYTMLAMLGRGGPLSGPLSQATRRAEAIIRESAPLWRGRGFNNTAREARPDGIALDTYCMVGWLLEDEAMSREVAGAIEQDRWLPPGWYDGVEAFRAPADECWCLRLIAATTGLEAVPRAGAVLDRIEREFLSRARGTDVDTGTFYEAWHIGMVIAEDAAKSSGARLAPGRKALLAEAIGVLDRWAAVRPDVDGPTADVLEWSNLASADALNLAGAEGARLKQRALRAVLSSQGEDGCWMGSSFVTLRALLALQCRTCGPEARAPTSNRARALCLRSPARVVR